MASCDPRPWTDAEFKNFNTDSEPDIDSDTDKETETETDTDTDYETDTSSVTEYVPNVRKGSLKVFKKREHGKKDIVHLREEDFFPE